MWASPLNLKAAGSGLPRAVLMGWGAWEDEQQKQQKEHFKRVWQWSNLARQSWSLPLCACRLCGLGGVEGCSLDLTSGQGAQRGWSGGSEL